jgi:hypothetical protein
VPSLNVALHINYAAIQQRFFSSELFRVETVLSSQIGEFLREWLEKRWEKARLRNAIHPQPSCGDSQSLVFKLPMMFCRWQITMS